MTGDTLGSVLSDPTKRANAAQILGQAYLIAFNFVAREPRGVKQVAEALIETQRDARRRGRRAARRGRPDRAGHRPHAGAVVADDLKPARAQDERARRRRSVPPPAARRSSRADAAPHRADRGRDARRARAVPGEAVDRLRRRAAPVLRSRTAVVLGDLRHRRARHRHGRVRVPARRAAAVVVLQAERRPAREGAGDRRLRRARLQARRPAADGRRLRPRRRRRRAADPVRRRPRPGAVRHHQRREHGRLRDVRARRALLDPHRRSPRPTATGCCAREALEIALYTFKYVGSTDAVVVFMPPPVGRHDVVGAAVQEAEPRRRARPADHARR